MVNRFVHTLDDFGAELVVVRRSTSAGMVADQITLRCPTGHPTGVTTTMLQGISASVLRGKPSRALTVNQFVRTLRATPHWKRGTRNPSTDALLHDVADTYHRALKAQQPPLQTVTLWLGSSTPTASNLIRLARRRRLIKEIPRPGRPSKAHKE